jgi:histidyl-tRNA synthetase
MSKQKLPKAVMGMREVHDLWPLYSHVIETSQKVLENKFGFSKIMPNIVESELTFNKSLGLQSDIVLKEMY